MKHVLIVEDHDDHAFLLQSILTKMVFLTSTTINVFHVLDCVRSKSVCAVILDIHLPGMSGDLIIKEIRNIDQAIPIIMVTANVDDKMRIKCLQLGANYYVVKPYESKDIQGIFRQY